MFLKYSCMNMKKNIHEYEQNEIIMTLKFNKPETTLNICASFADENSKQRDQK